MDNNITQRDGLRLAAELRCARLRWLASVLDRELSGSGLGLVAAETAQELRALAEGVSMPAAAGSVARDTGSMPFPSCDKS